MSRLLRLIAAGLTLVATLSPATSSVAQEPLDAFYSRADSVLKTHVVDGQERSLNEVEELLFTRHPDPVFTLPWSVQQRAVRRSPTRHTTVTGSTSNSSGSPGRYSEVLAS